MRRSIFLLFMVTCLCQVKVTTANASDGQIAESHIRNLMDAIGGTTNRKNSDKYPCFSGEVRKNCTQKPITKKNRPLKVQISLHLLDIIEVNQKEGTWTVRAFLYTRWKDRKRLKFKPKDFDGLTQLTFDGRLAQKQLERIWTPNLTIINGINRRDSEKVTLIINRNGTVQHKEIFTAKIGTNFNYRQFPFDNHVAKIEIEPFIEINKFVRLVPAVSKSGNSSTAPDTWTAGEFLAEFSTRPGARFELSSDKPGAWLAPDGANDFSLATYSLKIKRNSLSFFTTNILVLFILSLMIWASAIGWTRDRMSVEWPYEIFLGIIFISAIGQNILPSLPYLTLYNVLVLQFYIYGFIDLLVWTSGHTLATMEVYERQLRIKRLRLYVVGPTFVLCWWLTVYISLVSTISFRLMVIFLVFVVTVTVLLGKEFCEVIENVDKKR